MTLRPDLAIISDWIPANASVLDLGCGDGSLLAELKQRDIHGYGLEIDQDNLALCFEKGVNVIQQDLDEGLGNIANKRFDYVLMAQALQAVQHPHIVLDEMLRVGREAIITFPNFGYWRLRAYLGLKGRMPVSRTLPWQWYDTPNIHFFTIRDFDVYCAEKGIRVLDRLVLNHRHQTTVPTQLLPNLFGELALYRLTR